MPTSEQPTLQRAVSHHYAPTSTQRQRPWREAILLARYHTRLLNWWLVLLMALGFLGAGFLVWLPLHAGGAQGVSHAMELCQFVLEPSAGLLAAMLASSLIVNDPLLEVTMATRAGIARVVLWRALLTFLLLLFGSAAFVAWSLANGISYARQQSPLFLLFVWLAPVLIMGMLGLFGALLTRNAALGLVIAAVPLAGSLFLYAKLVSIPTMHPFFISYTFSGGQDAPDWWNNRLTLLGIAGVLAVWNWWLLRREERLLGNGQ
jgi:hypothetical protein